MIPPYLENRRFSPTIFSSYPFTVYLYRRYTSMAIPRAIKIAVLALVLGMMVPRRAVGSMSGVAMASASSEASNPIYLKVRYSVNREAA